MVRALRSLEATLAAPGTDKVLWADSGVQSYTCLHRSIVLSCSLLRSLGATATARLAHSLLLALRPMAWGGVGLRHLHGVFRSSPSARIARFPPAAARARRVRMELGAAAVAVAVTAESESVRLWGGAATRAPVQPPPHPALGWRLGRTVMGVGRRMAEGGGGWRTIVSCPPPPHTQSR